MFFFISFFSIPLSLDTSFLLNHPVRLEQHDVWNRHPDLSGRSQINHQLKPSRVLNGEVRGSRPFEDPVHVNGGAPE